MQHGLDFQHRAEESRGRRATAAALEEVEIIHRKPVRVFLQMRPGIRGVFINRHPRVAARNRVIDHHALARAGRQRIHQLDHRVGVILVHNVPRHACGGIRAGKRGGKNEAEHRLALFGIRLKRLDKIARRNLRGCARLACAQPVVKSGAALRVVKRLEARLAGNGI